MSLATRRFVVPGAHQHNSRSVAAALVRPRAHQLRQCKRIHQRASFQAPAAASPMMATAAPVTYEQDPQGLTRLKYQTEGWNFWDWTYNNEQFRIQYVQAGTQGPPIVLVHGYGASSYHWRYNIPALAKNHRVYSIDMLGFGWSTKAHVDYSNGKVWVQQISDFIKEVVGGEPVFIAGNSLGGFASLATAAAYPDLIKGLALLNAAGKFEDPNKLSDAPPAFYQPLVDSIVRLFKRVALWFAFERARQPERIKEVLAMVYADKTNLDDDLVESIAKPAEDPAAAETFFLINDQRGPSVTVDSLLKKLDIPVLLLWGDLDPWIVPSRAAQIMALYPRAQKVGLQSGHCPHDDTPAEANAALLKWLQEVEGAAPSA